MFSSAPRRCCNSQARTPALRSAAVPAASYEGVPPRIQKLSCAKEKTNIVVGADGEPPIGTLGRSDLLATAPVLEQPALLFKKNFQYTGEDARLL